MQTFMPHPRFEDSAAALDGPRLNKQRIETKQILSVLRGEISAWKGHPAVLMWRGHEAALAEYGRTMCWEWVERGGADHAGLLLEFEALARSGDTTPPDWVTWPDIHLSHRSNLIRKEPELYVPQWPGIPMNMAYLWPVFEEGSWQCGLSLSESRRQGWWLPDHLTYDPATRRVEGLRRALTGDSASH